MYLVKMFDEYWLRVCPDHMEELYDLEQATQFKTKKLAKEAINDFNMQDHCEIVNLKEEMPKYLEWKAQGMIRRTIPKLNRNYSRPYNGEGFKEVLDWWLYVKEHDSEISYDHYSTWPDIHKFLDNFYSVDSYWEGDYEKLVHSFKVMITKDATFKKFKQELNKLIPHVTYKDEEYLIFSIFDHECSEYESRYFHYKNEEDCKIVNHYGSIKFTGTLKQCFEEIQNKYYYD